MSTLCILQTVLVKLISELDYGNDFSNYPSTKSIVANNGARQEKDRLRIHLTNKTQLEELLSNIIIHHTHYEKSDWSRAFNQFTIACELDMINVISAADIAFIMSSSQAIVN